MSIEQQSCLPDPCEREGMLHEQVSYIGLLVRLTIFEGHAWKNDDKPDIVLLVWSHVLYEWAIRIELKSIQLIVVKSKHTQ